MFVVPMVRLFRNLLMTCVAIGNAVLAADALPELPLHGETKVRFASVEEGQKTLSAKDSFTMSLSRFDLQVRLKRAENATLEEWVKSVSAEVLPWNDEQAAHVKPAIAVLQEKLKRLKLPLPEKVLLVHTSGKEEGDAAYTRANAVILPTKVLSYPSEQLESLLSHELFHVLSRHSPETRQRLYGIIGFRPCDEIPLPASLKDRKLTNPDAPQINCTINLKIDGRDAVATPILYSSAESYDPKQGGSLFRYLTFRLMLVEKSGAKWQARMNGKDALLLDPKQTPSYLEQIGKNTGYIIHPDEILADNFIQLVKDNKKLPTPRIVEEMERVLSP